MKNLIKNFNRYSKAHKFIHRSHFTPSLREVITEIEAYDEDWETEEVTFDLDEFYDRRYGTQRS